MAVEWTLLMEVAALLAHPQQDQELVVMVDASANHVGAAALGGGGLQSLAFFSKKLEPAQMRYSAFDRELFTCVAGICHFCHMLEGRPFTIYTDHKPLTFALGKVTEHRRPRGRGSGRESL